MDARAFTWWTLLVSGPPRSQRRRRSSEATPFSSDTDQIEEGTAEVMADDDAQTVVEAGPEPEEAGPEPEAGSTTGPDGAGPIVAESTAMMPAWQVTRVGEPVEVLRLGEVPVPKPGPGQVRIQVAAAGLHYADLLLVQGRYQERPETPFVPGVEICGTVTELGSGVKEWLLGERVCAVTEFGHGGFAREAVTSVTATFLAPPLLDDAEAATFLVSYQTAWFALHRRAGLRVGETLLVHAAASGIGRATVELGRSLGARVITVVDDAAKAQIARAAGADTVFDRSEVDLVTALQETTKGRGVDVVVDPVGGAAFETSTKVIAPEGRIVVVGFAGGQIAQAATNHLLEKNYGVLGLNWSRYVQHDPELVQRAFDELDDLVAARALRPLVDERVPFTDLVNGLTRVGQGLPRGRQVLLPPEK